MLSSTKIKKQIIQLPQIFPNQSDKTFYNSPHLRYLSLRFSPSQLAINFIAAPFFVAIFTSDKSKFLMPILLTSLIVDLIPRTQLEVITSLAAASYPSISSDGSFSA